MDAWQRTAVFWIVAAAAVRGNAGPIHIVVNVGEYGSAQKAAVDEANVGWDDGKDADDVIFMIQQGDGQH